jgi:cell wall-associated NlpC family hydrolase
LILGATIHQAGGQDVPPPAPTNQTEAAPAAASNAPAAVVSRTSQAADLPTTEKEKQASLDPSDLAEYGKQPVAVQTLIADALALTKEGLVYKYGSNDPKNGGMDCSGTVQYVLKKEGVASVPRDASEFYKWTREQGLFQAVNSTDPHSFEFADLKPGALLFWIGTYDVQRDPPITHVMIYLGTEKKTGKRVMFGASEGRRYGSSPRYGVSVFDFTMPGFPPPASYTAGKARFIGYAAVPGLPKETAQAAPPPAPTAN